MSGTRLTIGADGRLHVVEGTAAYPITVVADGCRIRVEVRPDVHAGPVHVATADTDAALNVEWPAELKADSCVLQLWRLGEGEAEDLASPPLTLEREGHVPPRATRLAWVTSAEHPPFAIKVVASPDESGTVDFRTVLTAPCFMPWTPLDGTGAYRVVIREHDGRDFGRRFSDHILAPAADGTYPARAHDAGPAIAAFDRALASRRVPPAIVQEVPFEVDNPALANELSRLLHLRTEQAPRVYHQRHAHDYDGIAAAAAGMAARPGTSRHFTDILGYVALYGVVDEYIEAQGLNRHWPFPAGMHPEHGQGLRRALSESPAHAAGSFATAMIEAWAWSIEDRTATVAAIAAGRAANPELFGELELEIGASSYLGAADLARLAEPAAAIRAQAEASFRFLTDPPRHAEGDALYFISCDQWYFRTYYPLWLQITEYLKQRRVRLHFLICGVPADIDDLVGEAHALARQEARFRGFDPQTYADNISYSSAVVPDLIPDAPTYHACSRFLLTDRIVEAYQGPVLICDIDMWFRFDPGEYLEALDWTKLGVTAAPGLEAMRAWRRYLANTLVLPHDEVGRRAIAHLREYLYAGLSLERSWMLDQNALTYMVERIIEDGHGAALADISIFHRPTASFAVKHLYRTGQPRVPLIPPTTPPVLRPDADVQGIRLPSAALRRADGNAAGGARRLARPLMDKFRAR